ncbi:MAG: hypothetical protein LUH00_11265 [Lachnospiraceae bacterium]|nr:hypothetical protein [Lachnospiraceae bacterium]
MELSIYILQEELQKHGFMIEKEAAGKILTDGTVYFNDKYLTAPDHFNQKIICVDAENRELFLANITRFCGKCILCAPECRDTLSQQPELQSLMLR